MNKPNNFDNTKAGNDYTPIELGGHHAIIKKVEETTSRGGAPMVVVYIDFSATDGQPRYFEDQYKADNRPEKKWPFQGIQYILTEDRDGNTSRSFKGFCTAYEESNGLQIRWGGAGWGDQFKGRKIGVVFGEVEEEYNSEVKTRRRIRWFCDDRKADEAAVPAKKLYTGPRSSAPSGGGNGGQEWMPIPDIGEELPF